VHQQGRPAWMREGTLKATLLTGDEDLEVVGESYRQDNLWRVAGGRRRPEAHVRENVCAMLVAEDGNPYDPNGRHLRSLHSKMGENPAAGHLPADGHPSAEEEGLAGLQMVGRTRTGSLRAAGRTGGGRRGSH
jgi:hypothetical protein